jgi:hypothetical protein
VLAAIIGIAIAHIVAIIVAITFVAVACPPPLLPSPLLLPTLPLSSHHLQTLSPLPMSSPSLLLATAVAVAITLASLAIVHFLTITLIAIAIALFVAITIACHSCCHHHRLIALALFVACFPCRHCKRPCHAVAITTGPVAVSHPPPPLSLPLPTLLPLPSPSLSSLPTTLVAVTITPFVAFSVACQWQAQRMQRDLLLLPPNLFSVLSLTPWLAAMDPITKPKN